MPYGYWPPYGDQNIIIGDQWPNQQNQPQINMPQGIDPRLAQLYQQSGLTPADRGTGFADWQYWQDQANANGWDWMMNRLGADLAGTGTDQATGTPQQGIWNRSGSNNMGSMGPSPNFYGGATPQYANQVWRRPQVQQPGSNYGFYSGYTPNYNYGMNNWGSQGISFPTQQNQYLGQSQYGSMSPSYNFNQSSMMRPTQKMSYNAYGNQY